MSTSTSNPGGPPPPSPPATEAATVHLQATYTSPRWRDPQLLYTAPLVIPADLSQSLEAKTSYLGALRAATVALQDRINTVLTARMEEDAREAMTTDAASGETAGKTGGSIQQASAAAVDEVAEEENYGEEAGEEDEV
ncbi:hypothetical protein F5Y14DRAFT_452504 [Nemania sp. NC0429]|nr:hypothetical protein F5Y14DRAFT_452504 [Nemania sp. NC0429]